MAFPTEPTEPIVEIATDADYSVPGEDWDGQPTKVAPTTAIEEQGYVPGTPRPADVDNWLLNMIAKWLGYFKDFADELLNVRIVSDEWTYPTAKSRTKLYSVGRAHLSGDSSGVLDWEATRTTYAQAVSRATSSSATWCFEDLPGGAVITRIRALVLPGSAQAGTDRMSLRANRTSISGTTVSDVYSVGPYYCSTGSGAREWIDSGTISMNVNTQQSLNVAVFSNAVTAAGDYVEFIEVTYDDPGPRNF